MLSLPWSEGSQNDLGSLYIKMKTLSLWLYAWGINYSFRRKTLKVLASLSTNHFIVWNPICVLSIVLGFHQWKILGFGMWTIVGACFLWFLCIGKSLELVKVMLVPLVRSSFVACARKKKGLAFVWNNKECGLTYYT